MNDHPTWEQFEKAYKNIRGDMQSADTERAKGWNNGLQMALDELESVFKHTHLASDDGDICGRCGLDLRNEIHERVK